MSPQLRETIRERVRLLVDRVFWPQGCGMAKDGGICSSIVEVNWSNLAILPGSFNPLHFGHTAMADWMERQSGRKVVFQISQHHPIKKDLVFDEDELRCRLRQFRFRHPVVVTRHHGLYIDKAHRFPGAHIVMGADALLNMLNPDFYEGGQTELLGALEQCDESGTVFWVVPREWQGKVRSLENIQVPSLSLFRHLAALNDISSSKIRAQLAD